MRVLFAPDKFAGTLTAVEAAEAMAEGWRQYATDDEVYPVAMADGGPGYLDVLHAALGGTRQPLTVTGPLGAPTAAEILVVDATDGGGRTAYVESAQACGLHLTPAEHREPERATTYGVGELLAAAVDAGAERIVVGLGGSGTNDGGAGLLAALGATAKPDEALTGGPAALAGVERVDVDAAVRRLAGVELLAASDVDNPLLGLRGATNVFGPQKGVSEERKYELDGVLERFATLVDRELADAKGAGAAGGLGYGLLVLGAERVPGIETAMETVGLRERAAAVDLVVTGEGAFDQSSRGGKVVAGVAGLAQEQIRPCVVLAGQVLVGSREMRAMGVESAYSMVDVVGHDEAFANPADSLRALAARVARTWSPRR